MCTNFILWVCLIVIVLCYWAILIAGTPVLLLTVLVARVFNGASFSEGFAFIWRGLYCGEFWRD